MKIFGKKGFTHFFRTFLTNRGKNENEDEKTVKNEFDFSILRIEIRLCGNFHENGRKQFLTYCLRHFWLIEAKIKMKIKKIGKISSIFEFSISKLGSMKLFIKIWEKRVFLRFFFEIFTWEGHTTRTEVSKELINSS